MTRATAALLGAALLAVGLVGHETGAQPAPPTRRRPRVARIVLVQVAMPVAEMTETGTFALRAFFAELRRVGWVEGQNLVIERRSGEGWTARYPELAREVVGLKPDVIVAGSTRLVRALKAATTTVPVVAVMFTPVEAGLVASLARPGGNITGVSVDAGIEVLGKHLELVKEAIPTVSRIAFLVPTAVWDSGQGQATRTAAQRLGLTLVPAFLRDPIQEPEYVRAFAALTGERVDALVAANVAENGTYHRLIIELAAKARLPALYTQPEAARNGGLMAYGPNIGDVFRRLAVYVDRVLRGAKAADLPIEQPTTLDFVVNLKTAKALGLSIPQPVLLRATEVIDR